MTYRMCFRKITKWQKFKDFLGRRKDNIIWLFKQITCFTKDRYNATKTFIQEKRIDVITNRLGILILAIIPLLVCLTLFLYSCLWGFCVLTSFSHNAPVDLLKYMPISFGSVLLNIIIAIVSVKCLDAVIYKALQTLTGDLNTLKTYWKRCILPLLVNALIYGILLYKPAYDWCCHSIVIVFWVALLVGFLRFMALVMSESSSGCGDTFEITIIKK